MVFLFVSHSGKKKICIKLCYATHTQCFKLLKVSSILTWMLGGGNFTTLLKPVFCKVSLSFKPLLLENCFSTH